VIQKTILTKTSLAFGAFLCEDMTGALLFEADFTRTGDRVPLGSGSSCFHLWHKKPLSALTRNKNP